MSNRSIKARGFIKLAPLFSPRKRENPDSDLLNSSVRIHQTSPQTLSARALIN